MYILFNLLWMHLILMHLLWSQKLLVLDSLKKADPLAISQYYKLSTNTAQKKGDVKYNHVKTAILKTYKLLPEAYR